jgi:hypothetical protein
MNPAWLESMRILAPWQMPKFHPGMIAYVETKYPVASIVFNDGRGFRVLYSAIGWRRIGGEFTDFHIECPYVDPCHIKFVNIQA